MRESEEGKRSRRTVEKDMQKTDRRIRKAEQEKQNHKKRRKLKHKKRRNNIKQKVSAVVVLQR